MGDEVYVITERKEAFEVVCEIWGGLDFLAA